MIDASIDPYKPHQHTQHIHSDTAIPGPTLQMPKYCLQRTNTDREQTARTLHPNILSVARHGYLQVSDRNPNVGRTPKVEGAINRSARMAYKHSI